MADSSRSNPNDETAIDNLKQMTLSTAGQMQNSAHSMAQLSHLSRLEIDKMVQDVSELVPAGNVPTMILDGLARMQQQTSSPVNVKRDVNLMFRGMGQMLDEASYRLLVHVPARAILAYQKMLQLAGIGPEKAFPRGTWQFYVDYAMREDTARHTNETDGFDDALREHRIVLSDVDRITAWVMTAIYTLHQYDDLLKNEWRERIYSRKLVELSDDPDHQTKFSEVWRKWLEIVPYRRMADARGDEFYPDYRSKRFDSFLFEYINQLPADLKRKWMLEIQQAKQEQLPDYQAQMSIRGYLEADTNAETHIQFPNLTGVHVALVHAGRYYLIPVCQANHPLPPDVEAVRAQIKSILQAPPNTPPTDLTPFATVKRWQWANLKKKLPKEFGRDLDKLRSAPIILNFDPRNRQSTLSEIRQAERGIGDHALTIFDTRSSFCFDQSHIYFDGAWGAALAEIMTNEALSWANYLHQSPEPRAAVHTPEHLPFIINKQVVDLATKAEHTSPEIAAENDKMSLKHILQLRKYFKMRSDLLDLTVNDLMVLYRAVHGIVYQPAPELVTALLELRSKNHTRTAADAALDAVQTPERSPATLIPVDASPSSPRERLYPMTFEVPLTELRLLELHQEVIAALDELEAGGNKRRFNQLQKEYLAALAGFGKVMAAAKNIAVAGESGSIKSIKMLAHIPTPLQRLLDAIPGRWDVLNDIIKGREVFSNVGRVAKMSTLRRFITAKDDNEKKTLAWGVISDTDGTVRISLRDFRPHVGLLIQASQPQLAQRITQDYLDSYVEGFNAYIRDLTRITRKSPETTINMKVVD
jgi:hypothetical protein